MPAAPRTPATGASSAKPQQPEGHGEPARHIGLAARFAQNRTLGQKPVYFRRMRKRPISADVARPLPFPAERLSALIFVVTLRLAASLLGNTPTSSPFPLWLDSYPQGVGVKIVK